MSEVVRVKVAVDTDELREWADKHAAAGNHGVAHVLYKAASDGESLTEQALREAADDRAEQIAQAIEKLPTHDVTELPAHGGYTRSAKSPTAVRAAAARIAREPR